MTAQWHIPADSITAYLENWVDEPTAASIESHVLECVGCRAALAANHRSVVSTTSWELIERRIDAELTAPFERLATRIGMNDRDARTLAPTRALQLSWLAAMSAALLCAGALARQAGGPEATITRMFFLTLAPLAPLAAVVAALGTASEPTPDLARSTPASRLRIAALRATTVMLASIIIGVAASALLPGQWIGALVWLCPALALSALGALAAGRMSTTNVIGGLGMIWVGVVVVSSRLADDLLAAFRPDGQLIYLAVALISVLVMTFRPTTLDLRRFP